MCKVNTLVSEVLAKLEDLAKLTDNHLLEDCAVLVGVQQTVSGAPWGHQVFRRRILTKLRSNSHEHVDIQVVVVGNEGELMGVRQRTTLTLLLNRGPR